METDRVIAYHVQCGLFCSMARRRLREELHDELHDESRQKDLREDEEEEERAWRYILTEGKASWRSCVAR